LWISLFDLTHLTATPYCRLLRARFEGRMLVRIGCVDSSCQI